MSFAYEPPTRPLPPACRWLVQAETAHLLWNAGCIAIVYRERNGHWATQINWQKATLRAPCGSMAQGRRWVERWMEKRSGLPGSGSRRAVPKPRWMQAFEQHR